MSDNVNWELVKLTELMVRDGYSGWQLCGWRSSLVSAHVDTVEQVLAWLRGAGQDIADAFQAAGDEASSARVNVRLFELVPEAATAWDVLRGWEPEPVRTRWFRLLIERPRLSLRIALLHARQDTKTPRH